MGWRVWTVNSKGIHVYSSEGLLSQACSERDDRSRQLTTTQTAVANLKKDLQEQVNWQY